MMLVVEEGSADRSISKPFVGVSAPDQGTAADFPTQIKNQCGLFSLPRSASFTHLVAGLINLAD